MTVMTALTADIALVRLLTDNRYLTDDQRRSIDGVLAAAERAASAEVDAARYRWLRDPPGDWWNTYCVCAADEALFGDKLDAAIDAARSTP